MQLVFHIDFDHEERFPHKYFPYTYYHYSSCEVRSISAIKIFSAAHIGQIKA